MQTLSDLLLEVKEETKNSTVENLERAKRRMNNLQATICAGYNYSWLEDTATFTTIADTFTYPLPVNCRKVKQVKILSGGVYYYPEEITDQDAFDRKQRQSTPTTSDVFTHYNILENQLRIFPAPASSSLVGTVTFLKKVRPMTFEDYSAGTVAVTNGDATVTLTSGNWTATNCKAGVFILIDEVGYEVLSRTDATHLELTQNYQGSTASGLSYRMGDAPVIPEEFSDILWLSYCESFYRKKRDEKARAAYQEGRLEIEARLKASTSSKTTSSTFIRRRRGGNENINNYPTIT